MSAGRVERAKRPGERQGRRVALAGILGGILAGMTPAGGPMEVSVSARAATAGSPAITGLVAYEVGAGGALDGIWTIPAYEGRAGTETARGGAGPGLAGEYSFESYRPEGRLVVRGTLHVAAQRPAWRMTWLGTTGENYEGVGLSFGDRYLAALYTDPVD